MLQIFVGCLAFGVLFSVFSIIFGAHGIDHGGFDHVGAGGHAAHVGSDSADAPSPLNPLVISSAITAFGAVGLETLLPAALAQYHDGQTTLPHLLAALTSTPARILGLKGGTLAKGAPADLVLFDPDYPFVLEARMLHSRARNTAFEGRKFQGWAMMTFVDGEQVFSRR